MPIFRKPRRPRPPETTDDEIVEAPPVRAVTRGPNLAERLRAIAEGDGLPEDALEPALQAIVEATGASAGALCLFDVRYGILRLSTEVGLSDEGCRRLRSVRRGDPACWDMPLHGLLNRRAYLIESAARNRYVPRLLAPGAPVRTVACVPLYSEGAALGSIVLVTVAPRSFAERDIQALWRPLQEVTRMIDAVRRQAGVGAPVPLDPQAFRRTAPDIDIVTITAERDKLANEVRALTGESERVATALREQLGEAERLRGALAEATAQQESLRAELTRAQGTAEQTSRLSSALEAAERERERLAGALEAAATAQGEHARRESALEQARSEAEQAAAAARTELERARHAGRDQATLAERLARERQGELERLEKRLADAEGTLAAERDREQGWQNELTRLTAEKQALTAREQHLRDELETALAGQAAAADADVEGARERARVAEEARAVLESELATTRSELATMRTTVDALETDVARMRDDVARATAAEAEAVATNERLAEQVSHAEGIAAEALAQRETVAQELTSLREELGRTRAGARQHEADGAAVGARLEMLAAERDQLRVLLASTEEERDRTRTEARAERDALEARWSVEREQRATELAKLVDERDTLAARLDDAANADDLEPVEIPAPDDACADESVTVIAVTDTPDRTAQLSSDQPIVIVLDASEVWAGQAVADHQVVVLPPDASACEQITHLQPKRVVVNLAAPGALQALTALRAAGCTSPFWACIADPVSGRGLPLGLVEPTVPPLDPDAVITALGPYAAQGGRVVTTGADVDALMSLRQALSRRRVSVSMAWDGKQAADLLGVVKPLAVVIDLDLPRRDGYAVIAGLGAVTPVPYAVVIGGNDDAPAALSAQLADPTNARRAIPLADLLVDLLARDEVTPVVERRQKVHVLTGTGR
ncbi:MAG TPA: GAF domain-containing protein [Candidatus Binatia bacterium]|jgi:CheY-like chemotaxis protein|nr:GAF domain-containing protein [Candidatus Binatia bacterium]